MTGSEYNDNCVYKVGTLFMGSFLRICYWYSNRRVEIINVNKIIVIYCDYHSVMIVSSLKDILKALRKITFFVHDTPLYKKSG